MPSIDSALLVELRRLIADLGTDGGAMSPSLYDTAQVVRLAPPAEGTHLALEWLISQRQADGGWGDVEAPRARDLPTLAVLLALQAHVGATPAYQDLIEAGLAFLRRQAPQWIGPLPDDIPIGAELLLPALLQEAAQVGLTLSLEPYAALIALGERRRDLIARLRPGAGTTAVHSWEAWGRIPDPDLLDLAGSIGHSPAATAAWLRAAASHAELAGDRARARDYLHQAAAATGMAIPGVVPTVWPIARFEQLFGLYALLIAGLLNHPLLRDVVQPQIAEMAHSLTPAGFSFSDFFMPDGDDTAAAAALLCTVRHPVDLAVLRQFAIGDHFCTWRHELQPSVSATARAVHALGLTGESTRQAQAFLLQHQTHDWRWTVDKWNSSWLYTTCHVIIALAPLRNCNAEVQAAVEAILRHQHADGGWGGGAVSNSIETAYAVLTLQFLLKQGLLSDQGCAALGRATAILTNDQHPGAERVQRWIGKEMYTPYRVDRVFELTAALALSLEEILVCR